MTVRYAEGAWMTDAERISDLEHRLDELEARLDQSRPVVQGDVGIDPRDVHKCFMCGIGLPSGGPRGNIHACRDCAEKPGFGS